MGNTSYRVEEYLGYSGDEPKPRVLQKPLKCRNAHCGAMCCPAQAETCNGEPTKCFYYERRDDLYMPKYVSIDRVKQAIEEMQEKAYYMDDIYCMKTIKIDDALEILDKLIAESEE